MDLLMAGILSTLADKLANKALDQVIDELPGRLKRLIQSDPERKAALRLLADGSFDFGRDIDGLFDLHPHNVFLVKFSYCFQL